MSLRIFSTLVASAVLVSCSATSSAPEGETISCAIGPGSEFVDACKLEDISPTEFVIHNPGGGFRRFVIDDSGSIIAGDGAQEGLVILAKDAAALDMITVGDDRYIVPKSIYAAINTE